MAVRPIRRWGDAVLRTECDPVTEFDETLRRLIDDLLDTVTSEPGRAGLAANQIGVPLRAFSFFVDGVSGYVVNPVITATEGTQDGDEGCLSLPGLWYPLRRAARVTISGVDVAGSPVSHTGEGLLARCFQHEVDHLDGRLYVDRLEGEARRDALRAARASG
jgi:peptide deformylase